MGEGLKRARAAARATRRKPKATGMKQRPAFWTHDDEAVKLGVGHLYYFAPANRAAPPYLKQRHVRAIIDIAADGTLAGVELIDDMPPPPTGEAT